MLVTERCRHPRLETVAGFTIVQVVACIAILGILAAVAIPGYRGFIERARRARAIAQVAEIEIAITEYAAANTGQMPANLAMIGHAGSEDPWGKPIYFVDLSLGASPRVDADGIAVNTDYDLYSAGADGATSRSLNADVSRDDILRASDGGFVGIAADYGGLE